MKPTQTVTLTLILNCSHEDGKAFAHALGEIAVEVLKHIQIADSVEVRGSVQTTVDPPPLPDAMQRRANLN